MHGLCLLLLLLFKGIVNFRQLIKQHVTSLKYLQYGQITSLLGGSRGCKSSFQFQQKCCKRVYNIFVENKMKCKIQELRISRYLKIVFEKRKVYFIRLKALPIYHPFYLRSRFQFLERRPSSTLIVRSVRGKK